MGDPEMQSLLILERLHNQPFVILIVLKDLLLYIPF